ncbi:hypothetical protein CDD83_7264 [Cordyceps sp. RAO-2017]|nr:hypothetical protein CDD83_7264 [Cordyceps sp. RAO-2017]
MAYPRNVRNRYKQAAAELRAPFWDWAATSAVPPATVPAFVAINTPKGRAQVRNPLSGYVYPPAAFSGEFGNFRPEFGPTILHCPAPNRYPQSANALLRAANLKEQVYNSFVYSQSFEDFSSTGGNGISIEQVHNTIHRESACGEQFSEQDVAGFDPLFMLHHANVDRLWAFWEVIRPNLASFRRPYAGHSRFTTPAGTIIRPNSPLQPFFAPRGVPHTSDSVVSFRKFGYSYPGLEDGGSQEEQRHHAIRHMRELYGETQDAPRHASRQIFMAHMNINVEDIPFRPAQIHVFLCGRHAGSIPVLSKPSHGRLHGTVPLSKAIKECRRLGRDPRKHTGLRIIGPGNREIPISSIRSLTMELEDFKATPPSSDEELPALGPRHRVPVDMEQSHAPIETEYEESDGNSGGAGDETSDESGGYQQDDDY